MGNAFLANPMWRYAIAGFLVLHGIGHSGGFWFFSKSWVSPALAGNPVRLALVAVWLVAMVMFLAAGVGFLQTQGWWRGLAVAASIVSLIVSVLYIQSPAFNAAVADVVILAGLLVVKFPPAGV